MLIKKTVVILYESDNEYLAVSLKEQLLRTSRDYYVVTINENKCVFSAGSKVKNFYRKFVLKKAMPLYKLCVKNDYRNSLRRIEKERKLLHQPSVEGGSKAKKLLNDYLSNIFHIFSRHNPELIICMSAKLLEMCLKAREVVGKNYPIAAYIPNVSLDIRYVQYKCDKFFVVNELTRMALMRYGISENNIVVIGLPEVEIPTNNKNVRFPDSDKPVVMLYGGEDGANLVYKAFAKLVLEINDFNIVVDTGNDEKATSFYKKINAVKKATGRVLNNIKIVNSKTEKLDLSGIDMLITVPRLSVVYEALSRGVVISLVSAISENEKKLMQMLADSNVVKSIDVKDGGDVIAEILKEKSTLVENGKLFLKPLMGDAPLVLSEDTNNG